MAPLVLHRGLDPRLGPRAQVMAGSTGRQTSRERPPPPAPQPAASEALAGHALLRLAEEQRAHLSREVERAAADHHPALATRRRERRGDRPCTAPTKRRASSAGGTALGESGRSSARSPPSARARAASPGRPCPAARRRRAAADVLPGAAAWRAPARARHAGCARRRRRRLRSAPGVPASAPRASPPPHAAARTARSPPTGRRRAPHLCAGDALPARGLLRAPPSVDRHSRRA